MLNKTAQGANALENYWATSQKTRSEFGRMAETAGFQPTGAQAAADQARVEAAAKLSTAAYVSGDVAAKARIEN